MDGATASERPGRQYWAFISYSQRDKEWSQWLQRSIENYRVPRRLVGRASRDGFVPRRLFPVFRDREELPTSADLGSNIAEALRASRYLIVVCSPNAAASRWVNEEVRGFKALGREDRVLAIIVDGEPNASDKPDAGVPECFPPALRHRVGPNGELTADRTEPIAADARPDRDGRSNARLKILAGLLGVGFDELRQRERIRRRRRRMWIAAAAAAAIGLLTGTWWLQERAKKRGVDRELASKYEERGRQLAEKGDEAGAAILFATANSLEATRTRRDAALFHLQHLSLPVVTVEHGAKISCVGFDPPGARFLTMSDEGPASSEERSAGLLRVWNAENGTRRFEFPVDNDTYYFRRAFFTRDGTRIFTALENARLWDSQTGKPIAPPIPFKSIELGGGGFTESSYVERAGLDQAGKTVVLVWNEGFVQSWNADTSQPLTNAEKRNVAGPEFAFLWEDDRIPRFSPDGKISVRAPDMTGPVQLMDVATGKPIGQPLQQEANIEVAGFSPTSAEIVTGAVNGAAYIWRIRSPDEVSRSGTPMKHPGILSSARYSPDGQFILTVSGNAAYLWNQSAQLEMVMPVSAEIGAARISSDSRFIVTGSNDGTAAIWKIADRRFLPRLISSDHWAGMQTPVLSPDGRMLFAQFFPERRMIGVTANGIVTEPAPIKPQVGLWDVRTGAALWKKVEHEPEIVGVAFSPDARTIATVDSAPMPRNEPPKWGEFVPKRKTLRFWNAKTAEPVTQPWEVPGPEGGDSENPEFVLAFSADSSQFLLVHNGFLKSNPPGGGLTPEAILQLFDARTGQAIGESRKADRHFTSAAFLRSGDILLAARAGVYRWNGRGEPAIESWIGMDALLTIAVSPDESVLLTVSRSEGRFWNLKTRRAMGRPLQKNGLTEVHNAGFSPDGQLAITTDGRRVRLWDPHSGEEIGREFSLPDAPGFGHPPPITGDHHLLAAGREGIWDRDLSWLLRDISPEKLLAEAQLLSHRRVTPDGRVDVLSAGDWNALAAPAKERK